MSGLRRHIAMGWCVLVAGGLACAAPPPPDSGDQQVYRRAESDRARMLEREVQRLRADLAAAEEALVAAESGLRGDRSRADAVSMLAGARIELDRARSSVPWQRAALDEAEEKLAEAQRQIDDGYFGSAIFFVKRAERITDRAREESQVVKGATGVRRISGGRVNLRGGPSTGEQVLAVLTRGTPVFEERTQSDWILVRTVAGHVGWVHADLLD